MAGDGEGIIWKVLDVESPYPKELGGSLELSNDTFFSLRIKNVTSQSSGTYKCTLGEQSGKHNLSSTVTLKVTGTVQTLDCPILHVAFHEGNSLKIFYKHQSNVNTLLYILGCPGIEDEKLKKYKTELFMLTCLGIFYLLLIFFTCVSNSLSHKQTNQNQQENPTHFLC